MLVLLDIATDLQQILGQFAIIAMPIMCVRTKSVQIVPFASPKFSAPAGSTLTM